MQRDRRTGPRGLEQQTIVSVAREGVREEHRITHHIGSERHRTARFGHEGPTAPTATEDIGHAVVGHEVEVERSAVIRQEPHPRTQLGIERVDHIRAVGDRVVLHGQVEDCPRSRRPGQDALSRTGDRVVLESKARGIGDDLSARLRSDIDAGARERADRIVGDPQMEGLRPGSAHVIDHDAIDHPTGGAQGTVDGVVGHDAVVLAR